MTGKGSDATMPQVGDSAVQGWQEVRSGGTWAWARALDLWDRWESED